MGALCNIVTGASWELVAGTLDICDALKHHMLVRVDRIRIELPRWREKCRDNMPHGKAFGHPVGSQGLHKDEAARVGNLRRRNQTTIEQWDPRREQW